MGAGVKRTRRILVEELPYRRRQSNKGLAGKRGHYEACGQKKTPFPDSAADSAQCK